jgi:hypothetical protein
VEPEKNVGGCQDEGSACIQYLQVLIPFEIPTVTMFEEGVYKKKFRS